MKTLFTITLLFSLSALRAADITVSSVAEMNAALSIIKPGESIIWKNGRYTDLVIDFSPATRGNAERRITLKAETPGQVVLTGRSRIFIGGEY
ncbi:MAG: alginate lyase, partial [Bacteroidetes bacterium]|nr:alginate lyase [Bacteroidota bacterium]